MRKSRFTESQNVDILGEGNQDCPWLKSVESKASATRSRNDVRDVHRMAKAMGIAMLFTQPEKLNQNAFVERFNRSFRDEVLLPIYLTQWKRLKRR